MSHEVIHKVLLLVMSSALSVTIFCLLQVIQILFRSKRLVKKVDEVRGSFSTLSEASRKAVGEYVDLVDQKLQEHTKKLLVLPFSLGAVSLLLFFGTCVALVVLK